MSIYHIEKETLKNTQSIVIFSVGQKGAEIQEKIEQKKRSFLMNLKSLNSWLNRKIKYSVQLSAERALKRENLDTKRRSIFSYNDFAFHNH
ncbi:MAG: hypothetical protein ACTSWL_04245 [Promethearchaeota archaeon]